MLEAPISKTGWCEDGGEKGCCTSRDMFISHLTMFLPQTLPAWHLHDCASLGYDFAITLLERHFVSSGAVFG